MPLLQLCRRHHNYVYLTVRWIDQRTKSTTQNTGCTKHSKPKLFKLMELSIISRLPCHRPSSSEQNPCGQSRADAYPRFPVGNGQHDEFVFTVAPKSDQGEQNRRRRSTDCSARPAVSGHGTVFFSIIFIIISTSSAEVHHSSWLSLQICFYERERPDGLLALFKF